MNSVESSRLLVRLSRFGSRRNAFFRLGPGVAGSGVGGKGSDRFGYGSRWAVRFFLGKGCDKKIAGRIGDDLSDFLIGRIEEEKGFFPIFDPVEVSIWSCSGEQMSFFVLNER